MVRAHATAADAERQRRPSRDALARPRGPQHRRSRGRRHRRRRLRRDVHGLIRPSVLTYGSRPRPNGFDSSRPLLATVREVSASTGAFGAAINGTALGAPPFVSGDIVEATQTVQAKDGDGDYGLHALAASGLSADGSENNSVIRVADTVRTPVRVVKLGTGTGRSASHPALRPGGQLRRLRQHDLRRQRRHQGHHVPEHHQRFDAGDHRRQPGADAGVVARPRTSTSASSATTPTAATCSCSTPRRASRPRSTQASTWARRRPPPSCSASRSCSAASRSRTTTRSASRRSPVAPAAAAAARQRRNAAAAVPVVGSERAGGRDPRRQDEGGDQAPRPQGPKIAGRPRPARRDQKGHQHLQVGDGTVEGKTLEKALPTCSPTSPSRTTASSTPRAPCASRSTRRASASGFKPLK